MPKVIDAILFAGELDMLEIRLNELKDVVDHFVLVEACEPHGASGKRQPTYLAEPERWAEVTAPFTGRFHCDLLDMLQPEYTDRLSGWKRENYQRQMLWPLIEHFATEPDDVVIVSDVDEIPRAAAITANLSTIINEVEPVYLDMEMFNYTLNNYTTEEWKFAYVSTTKILRKTGLNAPRGELGESKPTGVYRTIGGRDKVNGSAGWHFSGFFDLPNLRKKLRNFAHSSDPLIKRAAGFTDDQLLAHIRSPRNIFTGKALERREANDPRLPRYVLDHPEKFAHLTVEPAQRPVEDLIIGAAVAYDWPALRPYARSIAWSGFKGTKVLFVFRISDEAREELTKLDFTLIDYTPIMRDDEDKNYSYQTVAKDRYRPAIDYLLRNLGRFRYIVWTGVRDAIFQTDPTVWLSEQLAPDKIIVGGLGHVIGNCPYNSAWVQQSDPENYEWLKAQEAVCADTIAGEAESVLSLFQDMFAGIYKLSPPPVDQGVLNVLVRKSPYKEITKISTLKESFTAQEWFKRRDDFPADYFLPDYGRPFWQTSDALAGTAPGGAIYSILHLYDRSEWWAKLVKDKYEFDIGKARTIPGYMSERDLAWLAKMASTRKNIVEIGSLHGRSTRAMADNTTGTVHAVDWWAGAIGLHFPKSPEEHKQIFLENMKGLTNVHAHRTKSVEGAALLADETFDMIFIDAEHDYENVSADIRAWGPLLEEGGLICGHDWHHPPVKQAVLEIIGEPQVNEDIWWFIIQ